MLVKGNDGGDFQRPEPGTYLARCVRIVDIGTQSGEYQGKPYARRQVIISWELPTELIPEGERAGEPFLVSKFYTASLNEKATLRHDLINWRTRDFTKEELDGFDLKNILGKPCMVTYAPNENGTLKVTGVTAAPKGTTVPKQINSVVNFSLDAGEFSPEVFGTLSERMQELIKQTPEYREVMSTDGREVSGYVPDPAADDIPF